MKLKKEDEKWLNYNKKELYLQNTELLQIVNELKKSEKELKKQLSKYTEGGIKLIFNGKNPAKQILYKIQPHILHQIEELAIYSSEKNSDKNNLLIEGDNLQAMASLYKYRNKIDLIIADPPYNVGSDFRYNDKWIEDPNDPNIGELVKINDTSRHSKWLKFILPRLYAMKEMLSRRGVVCICIGDDELANLLPLMSEVFEEKNRLAIINWEKAYGSKPTNHIASATEYIIVYARDINSVHTNLLPRSEKQLNVFKNPDNDPRGKWRGGDITASGYSYSLYYAIQSPFTGKIYYPSRVAWAWSKPRMQEALEEHGIDYEERDVKDNCTKALLIKNSLPIDHPNFCTLQDPIIEEASEKVINLYKDGVKPRVYFLKDGYGKLCKKSYLNEVLDGVHQGTFEAKEIYNITDSISWIHAISGHSQEGTLNLRERVGRKNILQGVKPLKLIHKLVHLWSREDSIIMDPFAGSGTTGEAVLQKNKEDNGRRRFILIEQGNAQNNDPYCQTLTRERLKNIIEGKWADEKEHEPYKTNVVYKKLTTMIDKDTLLSMEREEMTESIYTSFQDEDIEIIRGERFLIGVRKEENRRHGIYLIWNGEDRNNDLDRENYRRIMKDQEKYNLDSYCYIYAERELFATENIGFRRIPDFILKELNVKEKK